MRLPLMAAFLLLSTAPAALSPLQAQDNLDGRVGKLEKEMRAVQRKVFPGADSRFFEPEITAPAQQAPAAGIPATTPLSDLTERVNALESSLQQLTGQVEQNSFKVRQLEEQMAKMKADTDSRLNMLQSGAAGVAAGTPSTGAAVSSVATPPPVVSTPASPPPAAPAPAPAGDAAKAADDPAEAAYMAGYKLWTEKKYPEAEAALQQFVAKYPKHKRASYAQNLLGRAYMDEGQPDKAAQAFFDSYKKFPRGERAPDSLYFLGQTLARYNQPAKACDAYTEAMDVYGATMSQSLKDRIAKGRVDAKCK